MRNNKDLLLKKQLSKLKEKNNKKLDLLPRKLKRKDSQKLKLNKKESQRD